MKTNNKKIIAPIILGIAFIINTILVVTKAYSKIDSYVHDLYMHLYSSSTDKIMQILTFFGSTTFIIILAVVLFIYFMLKKKKLHAYCEASLIIISTIINNVIKFIIRRPRPEYITVIEKTFSYPSGHTMASTTLYGFLIYLIIKSNISKGNKFLFGGLLGFLIFLVASSRIYLGAHFFSDVFGGIILSTIIILVFDIINDKHKFI